MESNPEKIIYNNKFERIWKNNVAEALKPKNGKSFNRKAEITSGNVGHGFKLQT